MSDSTTAEIILFPARIAAAPPASRRTAEDERLAQEIGRAHV